MASCCFLVLKQRHLLKDLFGAVHANLDLFFDRYRPARACHHVSSPTRAITTEDTRLKDKSITPDFNKCPQPPANTSNGQGCVQHSGLPLSRNPES